MHFRICTTVCCATALLLPSHSARTSGAAADKPAEAERAKSSFTLDEALQQLRLYPKDPYLQYVALQLARRENRVEEIAGTLDRTAGNGAWTNRAGRRADVDLFSIFTCTPC